MAAESHVDNSIIDPERFINTNILGTLNILQASLDFFKNKKSENDFCLHHVSTDEVYGSLEKYEKSFTEYSQYKPNSPYSASKAGSDHLVRAWLRTYGSDSHASLNFWVVRVVLSDSGTAAEPSETRWSN